MAYGRRSADSFAPLYITDEIFIEFFLSSIILNSIILNKQPHSPVVFLAWEALALPYAQPYRPEKSMLRPTILNQRLNQ